MLIEKWEKEVVIMQIIISVTAEEIRAEITASENLVAEMCRCCCEDG